MIAEFYQREIKELAETAARYERTLRKVHYIASRALAEPAEGTGTLVEVCTVAEKALSGGDVE